MQKFEGGACVTSETEGSLREEDANVPRSHEQMHRNIDIKTSCESYYLDQWAHTDSRQCVSRMGYRTHSFKK